MDDFDPFKGLGGVEAPPADDFDPFEGLDGVAVNPELSGFSIGTAIGEDMGRGGPQMALGLQNREFLDGPPPGTKGHAWDKMHPELGVLSRLRISAFGKATPETQLRELQKLGFEGNFTDRGLEVRKKGSPDDSWHLFEPGFTGGLGEMAMDTAEIGARLPQALTQTVGEGVGFLTGAGLGALTGPAAPLAMPALGMAGKSVGGGLGAAAGEGMVQEAGKLFGLADPTQGEIAQSMWEEGKVGALTSLLPIPGAMVPGEKESFKGAARYLGGLLKKPAQKTIPEIGERDLIQELARESARRTAGHTREGVLQEGAEISGRTAAPVRASAQGAMDEATGLTAEASRVAREAEAVGATAPPRPDLGTLSRNLASDRMTQAAGAERSFANLAREEAGVASRAFQEARDRGFEISEAIREAEARLGAARAVPDPVSAQAATHEAAVAAGKAAERPPREALAEELLRGSEGTEVRVTWKRRRGTKEKPAGGLETRTVRTKPLYLTIEEAQEIAALMSPEELAKAGMQNLDAWFRAQPEVILGAAGKGKAYDPAKHNLLQVIDVEKSKAGKPAWISIPLNDVEEISVRGNTWRLSDIQASGQPFAAQNAQKQAAKTARDQAVAKEQGALDQLIAQGKAQREKVGELEAWSTSSRGRAERLEKRANRFEQRAAAARFGRSEGAQDAMVGQARIRRANTAAREADDLAAGASSRAELEKLEADRLAGIEAAAARRAAGPLPRRRPPASPSQATRADNEAVIARARQEAREEAVRTGRAAAPAEGEITQLLRVIRNFPGVRGPVTVGAATLRLMPRTLHAVGRALEWIGGARKDDLMLLMQEAPPRVRDLLGPGMRKNSKVLRAALIASLHDDDVREWLEAYFGS